MKKIILLFILIFFLTGCTSELFDKCKSRVSSVIDGDTFYLSNGEGVRLIGIDTPEYGDYYYEESSQRLEQFVQGMCVELERDISERDHYGRLLRYVYVDEKFINLELVKEGFAEAFEYPPDTKHAMSFKDAESRAKELKLGIWIR